MKIISKYKDYYDGVQAFGIDKNLIYNRKEEIITLDALPNYGSLVDVIGVLGIIILELDAFGTEKLYLQVNRIVIGFCGKLIPAYQIDEYFEGNKRSSHVYYNAENLHDFYRKIHEKQNCWEFEEGCLPYSVNDLNAYFKAPIFERDFTEWFQLIQSPIFLVHNKTKVTTTEDNRRSNIRIKKNPILKNLEFYKIRDAFTVHQEIDQFIGGVLTNSETQKNQLNDIQKVKKHGFDENYGFRTRPKK